MPTELVLCLAVFVAAYAVVSGRLTADFLTAPMIFVGAGLFVGPGVELMGEDARSAIEPLAEVTLALVLFGDAARIDLSALRKSLGLPTRLLGIGLPLTILLGAGIAMAVLGGLSLWEAAVLSAVLAPTDAALGQAVVSSEVVPLRIRQTLNVESGLNDGIALPVVLALTAFAAMSGEGADHWLGFWGLQVTLGPLVGAAVGWGGGRLFTWAEKAGWTEHSTQRIGGMALAIVALLGAEFVGGNGFIAAFVAGLTLGNTAWSFCERIHEFLEAESQLMMMFVFGALGAVLAGPAMSRATPAMLLYAGLSLTVVRMVPVAVSLIGSKLRWQSVLFVGWFGPRGLASLLFGIVVLDEHAVLHREFMFDVVVITVLFSVLLHGLTASWGAKRYGRWVAEQIADQAAVAEHSSGTGVVL
ncbi:MAG: NhaP-type Na+/H+ or K+/H+ antiporter, partial [Myxococcota bacterium]